MALFSFIDHGNQDFLRDENGEVIRRQFADTYEAENWLLDNEAKTDWSNQGTTFWNWDED